MDHEYKIVWIFVIKISHRVTFVTGNPEEMFPRYNKYIARMNYMDTVKKWSIYFLDTFPYIYFGQMQKQFSLNPPMEHFVNIYLYS